MLYGNARVFNDLSVESQQSIWSSVTTVNLTLQESLFNTILRLPKDQIKLIPVRLVSLAPAAPPPAPIAGMNLRQNSISSQSSSSAATASILSLVTPNSPTTTTTTVDPTTESHAPIYDTEQVLVFAQRPVKPLAPTGAGANFLRDRTLREVLIEDFRQYALNQASASAVGIPTAPTIASSVADSVQYLIQGMELSLDLPIYELWCVMAHADMVLYITMSR